MLFSVNSLLQTGGLIAIGLVLFAETGMLIGFFLPGDTLLIAAGVFAAEHKLPLLAILPVAATAAFLGYQVGYSVGEKAGPKVFKRQDGLLFREEYITRSEEFFERHGGKTIIFARFIAIVRTVVPIVAGMGKMPKRQYVLYNIAGSILWTASVTLASFWLGQRIPNLDKYLVYFVLLAVILTTGGSIIEIVRTKNRRDDFKQALIDELKYIFKRQK